MRLQQPQCHHRRMRVHCSQAVILAEHLLEPGNNGKKGDYEQEDQTHIAGGDRHGGSFRRDGFSAAAAQERGPDWRV